MVIQMTRIKGCFNLLLLMGYFSQSKCSKKFNTIFFFIFTFFFLQSMVIINKYNINYNKTKYNQLLNMWNTNVRYSLFSFYNFFTLLSVGNVWKKLQDIIMFRFSVYDQKTIDKSTKKERKKGTLWVCTPGEWQ